MASLVWRRLDRGLSLSLHVTTQFRSGMNDGTVVPLVLCPPWRQCFGGPPWPVVPVASEFRVGAIVSLGLLCYVAWQWQR